MLKNNSLIEQLPFFFDSIHKNEDVKTYGLNNDDVTSLISHLLPHKLEFLSFLSIENTSSLSHFYTYTWRKQYDVLANVLGDVLVNCNVVFLQGFPRVMDYRHQLSPGMRSDIDIFVPKEHVTEFHSLVKARGFDKYVFSDDDIFIADSDIESEFTKDYWINKEFAITLPFEVELPSDLPIDFGDCYLPWLYRNNKWHLMVSVEVHHHYTTPSDEQVIVDNSEDWPETNFRRSNISSLLLFNLIRLYRGVLSGEKRLRLLLDTACLLANINSKNILCHLDNLIQSSNFRVELQSLCYELSQLHNLFSPLKYLSHLSHSTLIGKEWSEYFYDSLKLKF